MCYISPIKTDNSDKFSMKQIYSYSACSVIASIANDNEISDRGNQLSNPLKRGSATCHMKSMSCKHYNLCRSIRSLLDGICRSYLTICEVLAKPWKRISASEFYFTCIIRVSWSSKSLSLPFIELFRFFLVIHLRLFV